MPIYSDGSRYRRMGVGMTCLLTTTLLLAACQGGGSGINSSSQKPDPVVVDKPIAYVKRPLVNEGETNATRMTAFIEGGDLYIKDRASPSAEERNITTRVTGGKGDVKDVEVSYDGGKLLFALRLPEIEGADAEEQPTWNIWEYAIDEDRLRRVITSDIIAEEGQDVAPHYLPDGRIVFASSRQRRSKAVLLDEGKPQYVSMSDNNEPSMVLHVMNGDGSDIHQISFNQNHDLDPTVTAGGEILFSRWNQDGGISLYRILPDGTELYPMYGGNSHNTGTNGSSVQFLTPRMAQDDRVMALLRPTTSHGGNIVGIDVEQYIDQAVPLWDYRNSLSGPAQTPATANEVRTDRVPSPGGHYNAFFPLHDGTGRILFSWSQCRLLDNGRIVPCTLDNLALPGIQEAPPLYGIWIYDPSDATQLPIVPPREGINITEVVAAQPRPLPTIRLDKRAGVELDADNVAEGVGTLHIRSVYDLDGVDTADPNIVALADPMQTSADQRPARFLRLVKQVTLPGRDVLRLPGSAFGPSRSLGMREILGYGMIEPDGSVKIKVPANIAFSFDILDRNGRRIGASHRHWLQLRPGEEMECHGCHEANAAIPHGRPDAVPPPANPGAPATGQPFPNTNPTLFANAGESMAEVRARVSCSVDGCAALTPVVDIVYSDVWTDPAVRALDAPFEYRYADLGTLPPASNNCMTRWATNCRTVIHYEQHIHPLWSKPRQVLDGDGNLIDDHTCTTCHGLADANGNLQLPAQQLDLSDGPSSDEPDHFKSYRELLYADNEQEIVDGVLQDKQVQATDANGQPLFETDENGDLVLDGDGLPIPIMVPVAAPGPSMRAGAASGGYFLSLFDAGGAHAGWLTTAELRLIAEWLDIGAQYYNDPFAVPEN